MEMKKTQICMNKHVTLGLSILELSEILMCEFWYDYLKCFILSIKADDIH